MQKTPNLSNSCLSVLLVWEFRLLRDGSQTVQSTGRVPVICLMTFTDSSMVNPLLPYSFSIWTRLPGTSTCANKHTVGWDIPQSTPRTKREMLEGPWPVTCLSNSNSE